MSTPEISVVMPTHDRCDQMLRTLRAALAQEDVDLEVIVVDDGSTDDTPRRLGSLGDPRVRVRRLDPAGGVARARNAGIAEARAPWVAFLDDDDLWAPRKLRAQLDAAAAQGLDAVYCGAAKVTIRGEVIEVFDLPTADLLPSEMYARNALPSGPSNVIARTDVVRALGGFDPGFSLVADWDMWLRLLRVARFGAVAEILVGYVDHGGSMTLSGSESAAREYRMLVAKHTGPDMPGRFAPLTYLQWRGRVHRKAGRRFRAAGIYLRSGLGGHPPDLARSLALAIGTPVYGLGRRLAYRRAGGERPPAPGRLVGPEALESPALFLTVASRVAVDAADR